MPYRRIKGDKNIINYSGLVTEGFLSDHMRRNVLSAELTRNQLQAVWEKEYSYQLGVLLYYVATGSEYISPRFNLDPYLALDFNKPVFVSEAGQRLQYVIERLIDHNPVPNLNDDKHYFQTDPNNRLHTAQAQELLALIDNKELFEKRVLEIAEHNKQCKANIVLRNQGKADEIKLPQELLNIKNIVGNIKPKYEGRLLGLKHKLSKKNSTSRAEKYAVIEAINQKAEQLIAQYPVKSVAQIQIEMQSYLRREMLVLENQQHVKSALRKYIDSALQEIKQQQLTKAPISKSVPKEVIPLKLDEYIKLYFNKSSQTVRNRPFDTSHYKDPQTKKAGEYGANAKAWKITDIKSDELNLESVNAIRAIMQIVLKDIQPHLSLVTANADKKSLEFLQAGYIFNAFNQKMLAELKSHATESRKLELKQIAEFVRLIADDLVMGKTPQESLQRLQERNLNKVQSLAQRALCNEILRGEGSKTIQQEEANILKLAGIDKDSFLSNIRTYASIGETALNKKFNLNDAVNSFHREQMQALKEILVEAFARTALKMDRDIANKAKYPIVGMFAGMKELEINNHELKKDFDDLLMVTEGILSITKYFANNVGVRMLNSEEKQNQIIKINNLLASLIANFPIHPKTGGRVTANDIRREMRDELMNIAQTPELKGLLEKHINRVVGRQSTILENALKPKEEVVVKENQKKSSNEQPEQSPLHRRMF